MTDGSQPKDSVTPEQLIAKTADGLRKAEG